MAGKAFLISAMAITALVTAPFSSFGSADDEPAGYTKSYEYWPDGRLKLCDVRDPDDRLIGRVFYASDGAVERLQKFDRRGNKIEESLYDSNGHLAANVDNWAAKRWWYDDDSQLRAQIAYNSAGKAIERKYYSEGGKLIARDYMADDRLDDEEIYRTIPPAVGKEIVTFYNPDGTVRARAQLDSKK
jgi:hypothetical protein